MQWVVLCLVTYLRFAHELVPGLVHIDLHAPKIELYPLDLAGLSAAYVLICNGDAGPGEGEGVKAAIILWLCCCARKRYG